MNKNNGIFVNGVIVGFIEFDNRVKNEDFYTFPLSISRESGTNDIVNVKVSSRLIDIDSLVIDAYVSISGEIRTFNRSVDGKRHLEVYVFAKEVSFDGCRSFNNQVTIDGFLCKEPNYRRTPLGREVCDIMLAVNGPYKRCDYIPCIAWGRDARFAESLPIGSKVSVIGRFQSRDYIKRVSETEVEEKVAYEVSLSGIEVKYE